MDWTVRIFARCRCFETLNFSLHTKRSRLSWTAADPISAGKRPPGVRRASLITISRVLRRSRRSITIWRSIGRSASSRGITLRINNEEGKTEMARVDHYKNFRYQVELDDLNQDRFAE